MQPHDKACDSIQAQIDDLSQMQLRDMHLPKSMTDHVRSCEACKAYLNQMLALADRLDAWDVPEPKIPIGTGVMTRIAQLERDHRFNLADLGRQCVDLMAWRVRMPAAVAAVLILGLFVSLALNVTAWKQADTQSAITKTFPIQDDRGQEVMVTLPHQLANRNNTPQSDVRVVRTVPELQSFLSRSQLAPSTFVIILGAPPFPLSQEGWFTQPVEASVISTSGTSL